MTFTENFIEYSKEVGHCEDGQLFIQNAVGDTSKEKVESMVKGDDPNTTNYMIVLLTHDNGTLPQDVVDIILRYLGTVSLGLVMLMTRKYGYNAECLSEELKEAYPAIKFKKVD